MFHMKKVFKTLGGILFLAFLLLTVNVVTELPAQKQNTAVTTQKKKKNDTSKNDKKNSTNTSIGDLLAGLMEDGELQPETDKKGNVVETEKKTEKETESEADEIEYRFRNDKLLTQHFKKHGGEFDYDTKEEYEKAASKVANNKDALHKYEKEDGDDIYYLEDTNEFVVVSKDGYLRTYFKPSAGKKYFDRQ